MAAWGGVDQAGGPRVGQAAATTPLPGLVPLFGDQKPEVDLMTKGNNVLGLCYHIIRLPAADPWACLMVTLETCRDDCTRQKSVI